jgi:peptidoglycan/xylan/chitin deacetylase (PgdA/CDA1 family)
MSFRIVWQALLYLTVGIALLVAVVGCSASASSAAEADSLPTVSPPTATSEPIPTSEPTFEPSPTAPAIVVPSEIATPTTEAVAISEGTTVPPTPRMVVYAPILMYHNFDLSKDAYSVRPDQFRAQLRALKAAGFVGVTLTQIADALDQGAPLPDRPVAITMDDARATQKTAIEILQEEGFSATMFVPSGWHDLSREFVVSLDHGTIEIGSHTVWHANLAQSPQKLYEIRDGKLALEEWLGHAVSGFAYPYGAYRPADIAELKRVGVRYAVSIRHGVALRASERYQWPRMLVSNDDPDSLVKRLLGMLHDAEAGKEPPAPVQWG